MKSIVAVLIGTLFFFSLEAGLIGPFLQNPSQNTIDVSWITQYQKSSCQIEIISPQNLQPLSPSSFEMTYMKSWWVNTVKLENLTPNTKYHYRLRCGQKVYGPYWFSTAPDTNRPVTILFMSDHQQKPMIRSTLKAIESYIQKHSLDLILFAGDFVDHPNNPEEWFFNAHQNGFFETMTRQREILQYVPIFSSIGNHEVTGYGLHKSHTEQLYAARPGSWNTVSYEEIFTLPTMSNHIQRKRQDDYKNTTIRSGPEAFYSFRYGNAFIISLFIARKWLPGDHQQESGPSYNSKKGTGRFIFEAIKPDSIQYNWLLQQLESSQSTTAKIRIVFFHHPVYSQGHNILPQFGEPYQYQEDYLVNDLVPLFEKYNVNLVYYGHDHIVNHFYKNTVHYLEASNIGNSYGSYSTIKNGEPAPEPHGLREELFIGNNHNSYFTILDTGNKQVSIYKVDDGKIISITHHFSLY